MSDIDLTKPKKAGNTSKADAYVYYDTGDRPGDPRSGDSVIVCPDCDENYSPPQGYKSVNLYDKPHYGRALPHMHCDKCGTQVTN